MIKWGIWPLIPRALINISVLVVMIFPKFLQMYSGLAEKAHPISKDLLLKILLYNGPMNHPLVQRLSQMVKLNHHQLHIQHKWLASNKLLSLLMCVIRISTRQLKQLPDQHKLLNQPNVEPILTILVHKVIVKPQVQLSLLLLRKFLLSRPIFPSDIPIQIQKRVTISM